MSEAGKADCIFCKIVQGDLPSFKVFENDKVLAFLDAFPITDGHTLVIPKKHAATLDQVPEADAAALGAALPALVAAVKKAAGVTDLNVLQNNGADAGQVVGHVHVHLIPRRAGDGKGFKGWTSAKADPDKAKQLQADIVAAASGDSKL